MSRRGEYAFGLDLRSLALCRIFTGLVIVGDLIARAMTFRMHYTDQGVLPRQAVYELGLAKFPSLYLASGWPGFVACLFVFHALVALTLSLGYQTRLTSVLTWYLTISLQQRIYMANNGGDTVLSLLLLWGMFVPWGEALSIDAAVRKRAGLESPSSWRVYSPGTALMAFQMPFVYWISVFHKLEPTWLQGDVLYYAFQSDFYARPISRRLLPFSALLKGLAYGTLVWEAVGPFLLLWGRPRWRLLACLAFALMHLSFGIFLRIGTFAFTPVLFLIAMLPTPLWSYGPARTLCTRLENFFDCWSGRAGPARWAPLSWSRELKWALAAFFTYGSLIALGQDSRVGRLIPPQLDWIAQLTGHYQRWSVFVNLPEVPDGWFVVEGRLSDGRDVDLFQGFSPIRWDKPPTPYSRYDSFRWPTPMVVIQGDRRFHKWFVRALALDWEADHPGEHVTWARFNFMKESIEPGFRDQPPRRMSLWEGDPNPP